MNCLEIIKLYFRSKGRKEENGFFRINTVMFKFSTQDNFINMTIQDMSSGIIDCRKYDIVPEYKNNVDYINGMCDIIYDDIKIFYLLSTGGSIECQK